jgi:hypothetical protein
MLESEGHSQVVYYVKELIISRRFPRLKSSFRVFIGQWHLRTKVLLMGD